jgi:primase-polymerase (primpol)-like protein
MELNLNKIPEELKSRNQWVLWKFAERDGKFTKIPLNPRTGGPAKTNDPATWGTFDEAVSAWRRNGMPGVGYVFSADDPFTGVDLDHALVDGSPRLCAQVILEQLASYSEISPSGRGAHVILKGTLPPGRNRRTFPCGLGFEAYGRLRFFTITGAHLAGIPTKIEDRQAELTSTPSNI